MPSASANQGRELVDADGDGLAGTERRAPIGNLLGGGVESAGGRGCQRAFHRPAIADVHLIGLAVLGQRHIARAPGVRCQRSRATRPADGQVTGAARRPPWLVDMAHLKRPQPSAIGRECRGDKGLVTDRL